MEHLKPVAWYKSTQGWLDRLENASASVGSDPVGFTVSGYPVVNCCKTNADEVEQSGSPPPLASEHFPHYYHDEFFLVVFETFGIGVAFILVSGILFKAYLWATGISLEDCCLWQNRLIRTGYEEI